MIILLDEHYFLVDITTLIVQVILLMKSKHQHQLMTGGTPILQMNYRITGLSSMVILLVVAQLDITQMLHSIRIMNLIVNNILVV